MDATFSHLPAALGVNPAVTRLDPQSLVLRRTVQDLALSIEFNSGLPKRTNIRALQPGREYLLAVTVTDGSTLAVTATIAFTYQGESWLLINHPPRAKIHAPAAGLSPKQRGLFE